MKNEQVETFEIGYRHSFSDRGELGATLFYSQYTDILGYAYEGTEVKNYGDPFAVAYLEFQSQRENIVDAESFGLNAYKRIRERKFDRRRTTGNIPNGRPFNLESERLPPYLTAWAESSRRQNIRSLSTRSLRILY